MTVTATTKDPEALTLTVETHFDATVDQVWTLWADPRRLERWWGPPGYPATFVDHDLSPGGTVTYFMTSPEGEKYHGWWRIESVEATRSIELVDGFADENAVPNPDMPTTRMRLAIEPVASGGTAMTIVSTFPSLEQMEQLVSMGMVEGLTMALGQIEAILAG